MKLNEIVLNEVVKKDSKVGEVYLVDLDDGAGFNVNADSASDAREKAKGKIRSGQVIKKITKDRQSSGDLDEKKAKMKKFVDNSRKLQKEPSAQKKFNRQIDSATTSSKLQQVSDAISAYGSDPKGGKGQDKKGFGDKE